MLSRFFGERVGGVRFFEMLDHLKADPLVNYPVLELQHACLALGFQGIHRTSAGGLANLQLIQRNLYELLRRVRPKTMSDLSPHWRGQALAGRRQRLRFRSGWSRRSSPRCCSGPISSCARCCWPGRECCRGGARAASQPAAIELKRQVIAPPPPPPPPPPPDRITQLQRIRNALAKETSPAP